MKIEISKGEYKTLLQILEIADWVLNSCRDEGDPRTKKHRILEQKLLSLADAMGCGDLVEARDGEFMQTKKYEDTMSAMGFIEEFENEAFWEELVDRLAWRDLVEELGEEGLRKMPLEESFERRQSFEKKYSDEFEEDGLSNLRLACEPEVGTRKRHRPRP